VSEAPFLILDEPTSALDPAHEQHLVETLLALRGRRTVVLVTHRLESVVHCDRIFVMEAGRIVEEGTHRRLIATNGAYACMWGRAMAAE
jgi:ATP-binding cassette, subfamily B, bacterial